MINNKQKALIHVGKAQLGLSDEEYREILKANGHVESSKDLDDLGCERVLRLFRDLGFEQKKKPRRGPDFSIRATEGQRKVLYHLMEDLGWWPARLYGFVEKMTGNPNPEMLTKDEASKTIEGLKKMRGRTVTFQWGRRQVWVGKARGGEGEEKG